MTDFDYSKTIKNLEKRFNFEKKERVEFSFFKLERSFKLMELLGNPHESNAYIIHIAGTNGKGSVSSLLSSILSLKYKVGLYTSPHLYDYTERIKINKKNIPKKNFIDIYNGVEKMIANYERKSGIQFSFFEILTAISFIYFKKNDVDVNIIETGLGGTLDTTNVLNSDIQVITPISFDHQNVLGNDIESIAKNKAGIIKKKSIVVTSKQIEQAFKVIKNESIKNESKLISSDYALKTKPYLKNYRMNSVIEIENRDYRISTNSIGSYYLDNVALSIQAICQIKKLKISKSDIEAGVESNNWPCRGNIKKYQERTFYIDGAHNEDGFKKLDTAICEFLKKDFIFIFGMNKNHSIDSAINFIKKYNCKTIISKSKHPKSEGIKYIEKKLQYNNINYIKSNNTKEALNISLKESKISEIIVTAGSLFVSSEINELINDE
jgi:dihydrofolate synthase/folylpolyglutamate synthase